MFGRLQAEKGPGLAFLVRQDTPGMRSITKSWFCLMGYWPAFQLHGAHPY